MKKDDAIEAVQFCSLHRIDISFLDALDETGLIGLERTGDEKFIPLSQLRELERIIRLHDDLGLNADALETVIYLIQRTQDLQNEINALMNKLRLYEDI
jgi:hypothetical protein